MANIVSMPQGRRRHIEPPPPVESRGEYPNHLWDIRYALNLTLNEMGDLVGRAHQNYQVFEQGRREFTLEKLCEITEKINAHEHYKNSPFEPYQLLAPSRQRALLGPSRYRLLRALDDLHPDVQKRLIKTAEEWASWARTGTDD